MTFHPFTLYLTANSGGPPLDGSSGNGNRKTHMKLMNLLKASQREEDFEIDDDEGDLETEVLGPFELKEFKAAFAIVSQGKATLELNQVEDVWLALGYTLIGSELRHLLQSIHKDKNDKVTIDSLEHTYLHWRRCLSDHSKDFQDDYTRNVKVLYQMLIKEERIPSVYFVKSKHKNNGFENWSKEVQMETSTCSLDENILRNILGQVSIDDQVYDHEDIEPDAAKNVMKELITYDWKNLETIEGMGGGQIKEKDFIKFMQFR